VITRYLQEHTSIDVFNIRQALLAEKDKYLLYPLVDNFESSSRDVAHYNEIGAYFAYRELMNHINTYFPHIVPYELSDIDISYDAIGQAFVSLKPKIVSKKLDNSFFDDVDMIRPFTWENSVYENTESNLPKILFLRDSYSNDNYVGKFIAQHFGETLLIRYDNMKYLDEYLAKYKPDIVVFEVAERSLKSFATSIVPDIPALH